MQKISRQLMAAVITLLLALLLVACGESNTATQPVAATAPASPTSGQAATVTNSSGGGSTTSTTTLVAAPTTVVSRFGFKESDLPVYPGAKRVDSMSGSETKALLVYYLTADKADDVAFWASTAFLDKGWHDLELNSSNDKADIRGKNDKYGLYLTVAGGNSEAAKSYRQSIDGAGLNDTVIVVTINELETTTAKPVVTAKTAGATKLPATTAEPVTTSAPAKAPNAVIATYPNAQPLDVSQTVQQAFGDSGGALDIKDAKYQTFVVADASQKVVTFYEADWEKQGFEQELAVKTGSLDVSNIREVYSNDTSKVAIVAIGPMDTSYLQHVASDIDGLKA